MRGNPSRARRRAARAVRQTSRMTDYQRNRQAEQLRGVDKIRDYLDDIDLDVTNELEDGALADMLIGGAVEQGLTNPAVDYHPQDPSDQGKSGQVDDSAGPAAEVVHPTTHYHSDTEPVREPNAYELAILGALQHKSVYLGDVPVDEIRRRRLRNRDSKRARRLQRRSKVRRMKRRHRAAVGNAAAFAMFMLTAAFIGAVTMLDSPGWWIS
nr:hypothetical protein [Mycobacteroides immunogenum]